MLVLGRLPERLGTSSCINGGRSDGVLHYCVLDFEFTAADSQVPERVSITMFPWHRQML